MPALPSSILDGRFVLESERGNGGMGSVWRARDLLADGPVAIKLLHDARVDHLARFGREIELLARLSHPGIVRYLGHGTTPDQTMYLAMEWLEGETLAERLARKPLTLHESLALAQGAARALAVAHAAGIVHRDVKPSNLFLREGSVDDVVLLDLGLARQLDDPQRLTRSGSVLGTPVYMSPEQAQGKRDITPASDVYSVGCALFECLAGAPPFLGSQIYAVLAKVLFEPAPRLTDLRPELPAALDPLLARLLEKDPARRPAHGQALLAELQGAEALRDRQPPGVVTAVPPPSVQEQELVSVIVAAPVDRPETAFDESQALGAADEADGAEPERLPALVPDTFADPTAAGVARYGGELRRLADGSAIIVLAQRAGAATDLAARAARCALRLHRGELRSQLVVATGRVIRRGGQCLGDAVDRAGTLLRALGEGSPRSIWLDEVTAGLLDARFQLAPRSGGVVLFELLAEDPSADVARPLLGRPTTCVGRERDLGILELTLAACIDEREARAILVTGAPGIGKSRLRHEFLRAGERRGGPLTVLLGLGDPLRRSGARSLLGTALARWCGVPEGSASEADAATFAARVGRHLTQDRDVTIAFLAELSGMCGAPAGPELRAARQNPLIMGDRVARAWLTLLRAEAEQAPVLLVLDDLQWGDAQTVSLVGAALRELAGSPFMVLGLGRPEVLEVFPDLWSHRLTRLPLQALSRNATLRLIQQVLGDTVSEQTAQRIILQAGGNALYLEELIRAADARRERVPETVLAMLQARIGLLPGRERRVLRTASVFGERFPRAGVQALLDEEAEGAELGAALDGLAEHEILEPSSDDRDPSGWRFRHALMRDAAYALTAPEDVALLHARAAAYLESSGEDPAVVATHAERGGAHARAIGQYMRAAERAYQNNDLAGVVSLVTRAIGCGAQGEALGQLLNIQAPALFYRHDFAAGWAASCQALALLPSGHPKRLSSLAANTFAGLQLGKVVDAQVEELLAATPDEARYGEYVTALGYAGIAHVVLGNRDFSRRVVERLQGLDPAIAEDAFASGYSDYWQMRHLEMLGDDTYATWQLARRAAENNGRAGNRRMLAVSLASLGQCVRRLYSPTEGERLMREAVLLAKEVAEPISWSFCQQYLANTLAESPSPADREEAEALALEAFDLAGDGRAYQALALVARSLVSLGAGEPSKAQAHAREAYAAVRSIRVRSYYPQVDIALLRALLAGGDVEGAAQVAHDASALFEEIGPLGLAEPSLRLWSARAFIAAQRREDAERALRAALAGLDWRAARIEDPALRAPFEQHVPEHRALRELARDLAVRPLSR
jgi:eukaryotic-like serine/threonine-protein kinase